jgi:hypothetical protein
LPVHRGLSTDAATGGQVRRTWFVPSFSGRVELAQRHARIPGARPLLQFLTICFPSAEML